MQIASPMKRQRARDRQLTSAVARGLDVARALGRLRPIDVFARTLRFVSTSVFRPVVLGLLLWLAGCQDPADKPVGDARRMPTEAPRVYVVNYPLQYFAERIGGSRVRVAFPSPQEVDPAHWQPDAATITAYQQADLILLNGAGYARWTRAAALPGSRVWNTSQELADQYIPLAGSTTHTHGPGGAHTHGKMAATIWLDPQIAVAQADSVRAALASLQPQHEAEFQANFASLRADLLAWDEQMTAVLQDHGDRPLLFSQPVYQYLERRYGMDGKSLHWEPQEVPSEEMWAELSALLAKHPARWMLWEAAPLAETSARLQALGINSLVITTAANRPPSGDFLQQMRRNAERLAQAWAE